MKIYVSPSNQTTNPYSYGGTNEEVQCNRIADALIPHLERNGYEVKRATRGNSIATNVNESNAWGAALHLAIHTNAGGGQGTEAYYWTTSAAGKKYAQAIYNRVAAISIGADRGLKSGNHLYEIKMTKSAAVLVECEYHDNADLAKWIVENVAAIGEAIARGICEADGKTFVEEQKAETTQDGGTLYRVQCGAFKSKENAENLVAKLKAAGFDAIIKEEK